jgi:hypothetical protein
MVKGILPGIVALALVTSSAMANYLMVTNYSSGGNPRSIMLFNKSDGSLVQQHWIVGDAVNVFDSQTEALAIGTDVWITDQTKNKVFRYDLTNGTFKPAITGSGTVNLSNIRGIECVGNTVYVANAGTGFGNAIVTFDATTGAYIGNFAVQSGLAPWDVKYYNGELLVGNYSSSMTTGQARIDRYDLAGVLQGNFYQHNNDPNGPGMMGPQQINVEANGNLLVGGFSGTFQTGVYEYNSLGQQVGLYANGSGPRAGFRLDNGNIMFTKGDGVWSWNPNTGTSTSLLTGLNVINAKYISEIAFMPEPSTLLLLAAGGLALRRRHQETELHSA